MKMLQSPTFGWLCEKWWTFRCVKKLSPYNKIFTAQITKSILFFFVFAGKKIILCIKNKSHWIMNSKNVSIKKQNQKSTPSLRSKNGFYHFFFFGWVWFWNSSNFGWFCLAYRSTHQIKKIERTTCNNWKEIKVKENKKNITFAKSLP